jgi:hypothetical protein
MYPAARIIFLLRPLVCYRWPREILGRELSVASNSDEARAKADQKFKKSQQAATARDKAMAEYVAEAEKQRAKTAKLKALRLAKEAEDAAAAEAVSRKKKPAQKATKK